MRENSSASVLMLTACLEISGIFKITFPLKTKPHGCLETQETGLVPAAECVSTPRMPRDTRKKSEINIWEQVFFASQSRPASPKYLMLLALKASENTDMGLLRFCCAYFVIVISLFC